MDDDDDADSGSAYVFTKPASGGWVDATETAKLTASDGAADDQFGASVAVDGDTVVVGAHQDDDDGADSGSAYGYEVSDWTAISDSGSGATNATSYTITSLTNGAEYSFRIRAANSVGAGPVSDIVTVTLPNAAPTAADDTATTAEDTAVDITVTSNDTDPDGHTPWVTAVTTPATGTAVITPGNVTSVTYTPKADYNGTDTFDYTVSDGYGGEDTGTVTVTVTAVSDPPVAVDDTAITAEDTAVDIDVVANDHDADGDTLSVTLVTTPSNGTAAIVSGSTTTVTYTPNTYFNGRDSFDYTLSDGADTSTGTVTVTVGPPFKPTGLAASAGDGQAALTWGDPSDSSITGYGYLQAQVAKLTASGGSINDSFGYSVTVDGNTVVVGAYGDDNSKGAAYVFTRQSGVWSQVAKLTAFQRGANDQFGYSVAVEAGTVVVGAYQDDDNGADSGSAYVFTKPNTGWTDATETAKLTALDGDDGDKFGNSVGVDGDTVVVGALGDDGDDDNSSNSGASYLFTRPNNGVWTDATETAKLTASDGEAGDFFGFSVAVDGDTVVVGADRNDANGADSGAAYLFTKPAAGWTSTSTAAKLTASDGAAHDWFGYSVAVDGDTVVVGADGDDDNGSNSGAAYLFTKPAAGWTSTNTAAKLTASDGDPHDRFGISVAVDGNLVVVGTYWDDDNGSNSGSAYLFTKPDSGGWATATETAKLTASDGGAHDYFGHSVAVDGDTVVVGAYGDNDSAYMYEVSDWTAIPDSAAAETNATSYTVTGLTNDEEYSFWLRATNSVGTGPPSDAVTATPTS